MSRKTYWSVLFNPVILILYAYGLSALSEFCKYGNVAKRLPTILVIFAVGVLWLVIWTSLWFVRKKRKERESRKSGKLAKWFLAAELIALILISGHYGYKIYQSAQPYGGKLWSYLNKLQTTREITLDASARNFLRNGLDGTLETVAEIEERESEEAEISEAKQEGNTLLDDDSGGMTFYLNGEVSMSLVVTDAAAGSRAYAFQNGDIYNEEPFSGRSGVAESIYFLDENTGFLLLSNASSDASHLYHTDDGGVTFTEIFLPVSDGEADMAGNEFDFTSADMDYIYTPYEEDGILYVEVSYDYSGRSYMKMLFQSEDEGSSWEYMLYEEGN